MPGGVWGAGRWSCLGGLSTGVGGERMTMRMDCFFWQMTLKKQRWKRQSQPSDVDGGSQQMDLCDDCSGCFDYYWCLPVAGQHDIDHEERTVDP